MKKESLQKGRWGGTEWIKHKNDGEEGTEWTEASSLYFCQVGAYGSVMMLGLLIHPSYHQCVARYRVLVLHHVASTQVSAVYTDGQSVGYKVGLFCSQKCHFSLVKKCRFRQNSGFCKILPLEYDMRGFLL